MNLTLRSGSRGGGMLFSPETDPRAQRTLHGSEAARCYGSRSERPGVQICRESRKGGEAENRIAD